MGLAATNGWTGVPGVANAGNSPQTHQAEVIDTFVGETTAFMGTQTETNCYNQEFGPYASESVDWQSFNTNVATVDFGGSSEAVGVGDTNIQGCVERTIWYNWGGGYCEPFTDLMCDEAPVEVELTITISGAQSVQDGSFIAPIIVSAGPTIEF